jgi:hypothetical protein
MQKDEFIKFKNQIMGERVLRDTNTFAEILGDISFEFWSNIHETAPYVRAGSDPRLDNITKGKVILERIEVEPSPKRLAELLKAAYEAMAFYSYTPKNYADPMWRAYVNRLIAERNITGFTDLNITWKEKPETHVTNEPFPEKYLLPGTLEITYNGEDWGLEESRKFLEGGFVSKVLNEAIERIKNAPPKPIAKPWYEKPTGIVFLTIVGGVIVGGILSYLKWN